MSSLTEVFCHLSEYARHPLSIGSVAPSSRTLAAAMTAILPRVDPSEAILELGPGTGAITRNLLTAWPGQRIVAVEKNARLASRLRLRYPEVEVLQGCVSEVVGALTASGVRVGAVVSGLPMLSFDAGFRADVLRAIHHALSPGAFYVQFTYMGLAWRGFEAEGLRLTDSVRVLRNVPPATILCFQKVA